MSKGQLYKAASAVCPRRNRLPGATEEPASDTLAWLNR